MSELEQAQTMLAMLKAQLAALQAQQALQLDRMTKAIVKQQAVVKNLEA